MKLGFRDILKFVQREREVGKSEALHGRGRGWCLLIGNKFKRIMNYYSTSSSRLTARTIVPHGVLTRCWCGRNINPDIVQSFNLSIDKHPQNPDQVTPLNLFPILLVLQISKCITLKIDLQIDFSKTLTQLNRYLRCLLFFKDFNPFRRSHLLLY